MRVTCAYRLTALMKWLTVKTKEDLQLHFINVLLDHMCCFSIQWKVTSHLLCLGPPKS